MLHSLLLKSHDERMKQEIQSVRLTPPRTSLPSPSPTFSPLPAPQKTSTLTTILTLPSPPVAKDRSDRTARRKKGADGPGILLLLLDRTPENVLCVCVCVCVCLARPSAWCKVRQYMATPSFFVLLLTIPGPLLSTSLPSFLHYCLVP